MAQANKRIPVTEERWEQLHDLKDAGQTYDELLADLVECYKERQLAEAIRTRREEGEFVEVDPDEW